MPSDPRRQLFQLQHKLQQERRTAQKELHLFYTVQSYWLQQHCCHHLMQLHLLASNMHHS